MAKQGWSWVYPLITLHQVRPWVPVSPRRGLVEEKAALAVSEMTLSLPLLEAGEHFSGCLVREQAELLKVNLTALVGPP